MDENDPMAVVPESSLSPAPEDGPDASESAPRRACPIPVTTAAPRFSALLKRSEKRRGRQATATFSLADLPINVADEFEQQKQQQQQEQQQEEQKQQERQKEQQQEQEQKQQQEQQPPADNNNVQSFAETQNSDPQTIESITMYAENPSTTTLSSQPQDVLTTTMPPQLELPAPATPSILKKHGNITSASSEKRKRVWFDETVLGGGDDDPESTSRETPAKRRAITASSPVISRSPFSNRRHARLPFHMLPNPIHEDVETAEVGDEQPLKPLELNSPPSTQRTSPARTALPVELAAETDDTTPTVTTEGAVDAETTGLATATSTSPEIPVVEEIQQRIDDMVEEKDRLKEAVDTIRRMVGERNVDSEEGRLWMQSALLQLSGLVHEMASRLVSSGTASPASTKKPETEGCSC